MGVSYPLVSQGTHPRSIPRCPVVPSIIIIGVRRTEEEPPQAEHDQRDAQKEEADIDEIHDAPIVEKCRKAVTLEN
jgi:hypothetical protein